MWFLDRKRPINREGDTVTMADELRIGLQELLRKAQIEGDAEFLKEGVRVLSQMLMEMEVEQHIGAGRHERSPGPSASSGRGQGRRAPGQAAPRPVLLHRALNLPSQMTLSSLPTWIHPLNVTFRLQNRLMWVTLHFTMLGGSLVSLPWL